MAPQRAGRDITKQMLRNRQMVLDQMDFKQKAEEKKMGMSKNIARLAVTAGLTAALSFGGVMAPVTMAFAADATAAANGITINKNADNGDVKYKAYRIFEADVVDEDGKTDKVVSNVKWAVDDATQTAIIEAINANTSGALKAGANAQDVADWLTANIIGTTSKTVVKNDDLLNTLAGLVEKKVSPTAPAGASEISFAAGTKVSFDKSGYYLFLTDANTLASDGSATGSKNTATSPIYAVVGAGDVTVTEKTGIPTVDKQVFENGSWGKVSDSYIGEKVEYKLTGSVANNIDTFTTYKYEFQDHLSVGLDADKSSVVVTIDGTTIQPASGYTVSLTDTKDESNKATGHDLTVSFTDLKASAKAAGVTLKSGSKVVVTYNAKLTSDAEYTATGNTNEVKLVYSNNPMTNETGTSVPNEVTDYVFGFNITKTDPKDSSANLVAGFKVKMIKEGTTNKVAKWLKQDGSFTDDEGQAYTFVTTGAGNTVSIPGLVAGTYLISESQTPAGYNTIADFEITVTPTYDPTTGKLTNLKVTDTSDMVATDLDNKVDSTKIPVTIQNKKGSGLPLTGLNGVTFTWIAGGAVLCIGVAHLIRSRKQAEESEQE